MTTVRRKTQRGKGITDMNTTVPKAQMLHVTNENTSSYSYMRVFMFRTMEGNAFFNLTYNLTTWDSSSLDQSQYLLKRKN